MMKQFGDNTNLNQMQRAFIDCIDATRKEVEKRRGQQQVPFDMEFRQ